MLSGSPYAGESGDPPQSMPSNPQITVRASFRGWRCTTMCFILIPSRVISFQRRVVVRCCCPAQGPLTLSTLCLIAWFCLAVAVREVSFLLLLKLQVFNKPCFLFPEYDEDHCQFWGEIFERFWVCSGNIQLPSSLVLAVSVVFSRNRLPWSA